ncbi:MAG TPA: hypothetical protein VMD30_10825 [Tepidisphaeraceae bacterium]|nr:hypothetical protein [Tepidisphaeraceae bacterium]
MHQASLQDQCELGQRQLMDMDYLAAEATLSVAERLAWDARDFDALARLYMPLQEARRQRRQRCGEGPIRQFISFAAPAAAILTDFSQGQLIVAADASLAPATELRRLANQRRLYVDVFLAAAYPHHGETTIVIAPLPDSPLPPLHTPSLRFALPPHCVILSARECAAITSYSDTMSVWERLHAPFMAAADAIKNDPIRQIESYRLALEVDYACELAHQNISDVAHRLARGQ